jgi:hypothetical protein
VRLAYQRQGHAYRDTVSLQPLWKLLDSYRATGVDTLGPNSARFHLAWDWPVGYSADPERDWMDLKLVAGFAEDDAISRPDVFQYGVGHGIEGGVSHFDGFDPARGAWTVKGSPGSRLGITAEFTLARREDHDLRITLSDYAAKAQVPIRYSFANAWPEGGMVRPGQAPKERSP